MRRHPRQHYAEDGELERLYDGFLVPGWSRVHYDVGLVRSPLQDGPSARLYATLLRM